jgi:hypothetical protein
MDDTRIVTTIFVHIATLFREFGKTVNIASYAD